MNRAIAFALLLALPAVAWGGGRGWSWPSWLGWGTPAVKAGVALPPGTPSVWIDVDNLDGLNNSTLTNGIEFSSTTIVNRGSLGGTFAGTTGAAPTFVSSCVGRGSRKPCLRFDGVNDFLQSSLAASAFRFLHVGPSTCFIVHQTTARTATSVTAFRTWMSTNTTALTTSGTLAYLLDANYSSNRTRTIFADGASPAAISLDSPNAAYMQQTWDVSGWRYEPGAGGNDFGVYRTPSTLLASVEPTAPNNVDPAQTLFIGRTGASFPILADVRGFVCYNSALSTPDMAALTAWANGAITPTPYAAGSCATSSPKLCGSQSPCRIGVMGDSISFAVGGTTKWPDVLRTSLANTVDWVVMNEAVSSSTIADGRTTQWADRLEGAGLTALIIFQGRNDIAADTLGSVVAGYNTEVANDAIAQGVNVLTISSLPTGFSTTRQAQQDIFNADLVAEAGGCRQHLDIYATFEASPGSDTLSPTYDSGDGVHPNQVGQDLIAATVLPLVGP
jgi:lysophospholipase L1-like esterase